MAEAASGAYRSKETSGTAKRKTLLLFFARTRRIRSRMFMFSLHDDVCHARSGTSNAFEVRIFDIAPI